MKIFRSLLLISALALLFSCGGDEKITNDNNPENQEKGGNANNDKENNEPKIEGKTVELTSSDWTEKGYFDGVMYYKITSNTENTIEVSNAESSVSVVEIPAYVKINETLYTLTRVGKEAFMSCPLISVIIPKSVTTIGEKAFENCSGLTSITIPYKVNRIDNRAFYNCTGLSSITCMPLRQPLFGNNVFSNINKPCKIYMLYGTDYILPGLPNYLYDYSSDTYIYTYEYISNVVEVNGLNYNLYTDAQEAAVTSKYNLYENTYSGSINIPSSITYADKTYKVTSIDMGAFSGCTSMSSIVIPNSVTSIGSVAFSGCTNLTSIEIPNSVKSIGGFAFRDCTSLTSVTIPNSVKSIGDYAFSGCTNLTSIEIPNSVTSIGSHAFAYCTGLTSVDVPNSVTSIGEWAFSGCTSMSSIVIPNSVTSIDNGAFCGCTGLVSIKVANGNSVYDSRYNCNAIIERATNTLICGCKNTIIPNSVATIGKYAFVGCEELTSITIPSNITTIKYEAFWNCTGLVSVTILCTTPPYYNYSYDDQYHPYPSEYELYSLFSNYNITLYVPQSSIDSYKSSSPWKKFTNIVGI